VGLTLATALATGAFAGPALAQQAVEEAVADDIVVTATKRPENAQDVPIAITALDTRSIESAGVTGVADLRVAVPALNLTRGAGGFGLPRIRGVGATGQGNGIENPVAVYLDGVYLAASSGVLQSLFDVDQVAVLKGPQGTLFGRNATGGLIQISTLNPSLTESRVKGEVGYGNYETFRAAGFVSRPLSDQVAVSLSGQFENRAQGFGRNITTGNDVQDARTFAARGKVLWEPTADTRILISADVNGTDDSFPAFANFGLNTLGENVPAVIAAAGGDPRYDIRSDTDPLLYARQWGGSLNLSHDFGAVSLKSITAYRDTKLSTLFDPDGLTARNLVIFNNNYDRTLTQEINLISEGKGPFKWIVGGFYMDNRAGQAPGRTINRFSSVGINGYGEDFNRVTLKSWSLFGEGTYAIGPDTNFTAGIRYTSDRRELSSYATLVNLGVPAPVVNTATVALTPVSVVTTNYPTQSRTFRNASWKLSLDHRFSPELMAYASYNRGFRGGTFIPQAGPTALPLLPELLDAFEVGVKTDLFDRRVRFNLSGYYYDQSSVQVMQVIAGTQYVFSAKGGAEIYGLDADFSADVTDTFRVFGGVSWNHATYRSYTDAFISIPFPLTSSLGATTAASFNPANYTYIDSVSGQRVANTSCIGTNGPTTTAFYNSRLGGNCLLRGDATGQRLQNTPEWTVSLGGNLDVPTAIGKFSLGGNLSYNSGFIGSPDGRVTQPAFTLVNGSLTWRSTDDNLYVRVWANNLTDAYFRTQLGASNSGDNGTAGAPRTFGMTVGFDF
jgi:iron complex outermembrane receptor protein